MQDPRSSQTTLQLTMVKSPLSVWIVSAQTPLLISSFQVWKSLWRIQMLCLLRRHNRPFLWLIRRLHNNLGHRTPNLMTKIIREVGSTLEIQEHIKSFQCRICERLTRQRPARPTTAVRRQVLGMIIATHVCQGKHAVTHVCSPIPNLIDEASRFHVATVLKSGPSRRLGNCSTVELADALNNSCMIRSDADGMFLGQNFKRYGRN